MTNPVAKKKQLPAFLVLTIISLIAAVALAMTNSVTKGPIADNAAKERKAAFEAVLPADIYEEIAVPEDSGITMLVEARNVGTSVDVLSGATVTSEAVVEAVNAALTAEELSATAKGFQSDVKVTVELDENKAVKALTLDTAGETNGFGTRCGEDESFRQQFIGKTGPFVIGDLVQGYCVIASAQGYAGPVAVTLGVGLDGVVTGAKIGDTNFAETAGFGMVWKDDADKAEQFKGISASEDGMIEAVTGATLTSNAVLTASNAGLSAVDQMLHGVVVTAALNEDGTIAALTVDASTQTSGIGTRCAEEAFTSQFIGKAAPFTLGEGIDAVSGATVTSQAVVNAVNAITAEQLTMTVPGYGVRKEPALVFGKKAVAYADSVPAGEYTASAKGFSGGLVNVSFTVDENSTITALTIDASTQTPNYGTRCAEDEYVSKFIGVKVPMELGKDIDVLSGATITSTAVVDAINSVAALGEEAAQETSADVTEDEPAVEPAADAAAEELTASAKGLLSDVKVTITLNADGTIATMVVDCSGETPEVAAPCAEEAFLSQFIGKAGPFEGIEAVSGATYTSNAVINAVNSLFPAEAAPAADAATNELTASAKGLLSDVKVTITLNADGTIATMVVDCSGETPEVAAPCAEDAFLSQFVGKAGPFEGIEVVSGATYTSNAVINAVNSLFPAEAAPAADVAATNELTASAKGLLSDVKVTITLNEDGTIATMVVDCSGETAAIAAPCAEEAFLSQFIGKAGPFEGVEVVSGATYTSNAVINAVNSLFPAEAAPAADAAAANELTASAKGLLSDVKVTITLNEDGTIATMVVDCSGETPEVAAPCAAEAFLSQFIGKAGPFEGIEVVSGATYTSNAVINAVNSLFPAEAAPAADVAATNELTASAKGLLSDVKVTIALNEDGTIATMVVDCSGETPEVAAPCAEDAFLSQFIGKAGPFEGIEVVSGATYTSNAVINAVNSLFPAEAAPAADAAAANELTASAKGLLSDVKVTITLNEDGTIATMVVDCSGETPEVAAPCAEEAFLSQFIGKAGPFEGVEVVSGATYTSNAVINAVNSLFPAE